MRVTARSITRASSAPYSGARSSRKRRFALSGENQVGLRLSSSGGPRRKHFTEMSGDGKLGGGSAPHVAALTLNVPGKGNFLHPAVHSGFFESLEGSSLSVSQARLGASLGKNPTLLAGLNQQEFDACAADRGSTPRPPARIAVVCAVAPAAGISRTVEILLTSARAGTSFRDPLGQHS